VSAKRILDPAMNTVLTMLAMLGGVEALLLVLVGLGTAGALGLILLIVIRTAGKRESDHKKTD
jgi:hypothetical protein